MSKNRTQKLDLKSFENRMKIKDKKREMKRGLIGKFSLTEAQVNQLYSSVTVLRDLALLKLAIMTGIRREDIVAIELKDVNWTTGEIKYYEQKKSRPWSSFANSDALNYLRMYVNTLDSHERYLFPGRHETRGQQYSKTHLTGRAAYNILQQWLIAAGLQERGPDGQFEKRPFHALRSTCIKLLQKKGWTTEQLMRQTGDSLEVIELHYTVPTDSEMVEIAKKTETGIPEDLTKEELMNNLDKRWNERRLVH